MLAGAPRAACDEEATELAASVFDELDLRVQPRLSAPAIVEAARLVAADLIDGIRAPRDGTTVLYGMFTSAGYPDELADFSGFDDWYDMIDQGIVTGSTDEVDAAVMESARALTRGETGPEVPLADRFLKG